MNVKKRVESRIRGWLPKEPKVPKAPARIDFRINQRPLITNQMGVGTKSTRFLRNGAIFMVIFGSLLIIQFNAQFHIALTLQIAWIIAGLAGGSILSALFTKRQLKRLAKDNEVKVGRTIADILFLAGTLIIFTEILIGVLFSNLPILIRIGFLSSVFAGGPAFIGARYILFLRWEKKNKMRILQNRSRFFAVPRSGTNSTVNKAVSSENALPRK